MDPNRVNGKSCVRVYLGLRTQPESQASLAGPSIEIETFRRVPLRLNSGTLNLHGDTDVTDAFTRVREVLLSLCDPWSRDHLQFIERYFSFIEKQCERHRERLSRMLEPFGSVYDYRDYRFSAWFPMPLACISMPGAAADTERPVRTDFLFWSGSEFIAVELCGHTSRSRRRDGELQLLQNAGLRVVDIPVSALRTDHSALFISSFPNTFSEFWADQPFPSGPLAPSASRFALGAAARS